jgi:RHS repeat-associated protein
MKNRFKILFLFFSLFQANALVAQYQLIKVNGNYCYNTEATFIFTGYNCSYVDFQVSGGTVLYEDDQQFRVRWTGSTGQVWVNYNCGGSGSLTTGPQSIGTTVTPSVSISTNLNNTCVGRSITFTASPTNGGSSPYYSWRVNGSTAPGSTNSRYYTTSSLSDNDVVTCVMSTSLSCYTQYSATSNAITMNLSPKDVMTVTVNGPGPLCGSGVTAGFYASVSNGSGTLSYKWFKNGSQVSTSNPLTSLSVVNGDIVRCEVTSSDACVQSPAVSGNYTVVVTGLQTFSVGISPNEVSMCEGTSVTFTANPSHSVSSYTWKMNGETQSGQTGSTFTTIASNATQLKSVQVTATTNASCVSNTTATGSTSAIPFIVKLLPSATITGASSGCGSVRLDAPNNASYSYVWKKNDAVISGETLYYYNVTSDGSYKVTTTLNGCSNTSSAKSVDWHEIPESPPVPDVTSNTCGDKTLSRVGTIPSGTTWYWQGTNPDGQSTSNSGSTYPANIAGTNTYHIRAKNTYCWSTTSTSKAVTVNPIPSVPNPPTTTTYSCGNQTLTRVGTPSGGVTWYWQGTNSSGTSTTSSGSTYTASILGTNNYYIRAKTSLCWSSGSANISSTVNPQPTVEAGSNLTYFVDQSSVTLSGASPSGGTWSGTGVSGSNFSPTSAGVGTHTITYNYNSGDGCVGSDTRQITVLGIPVVVFSGSAYLSRGEEKQLSASATYDAYQWYMDNLSIPGATNQSYTASKPGNYKVNAFKGGQSSYSPTVALYSAIEQSGDMNYIIAHSIQGAGVSDADQIKDLTIGQLAEQIQYFDGLGRPIQTVITQGSYSGKDIIQPFFYDAFGRDTIQYLPYVANDISGLYKSNAISDQALFYNNASDKIADDAAPYAVKLLEKSPLNRILEQGAPGDAWQPGTGHTVKMSYETNGTDEVLKFDGNYSKPSLSSELTFDGNNDYVALNMYFNQAGALPKMTLEAWVKTTVSGVADFDNWSIIDFDRSEFFNVFVRGDNGRVEFSSYATSGGINDFIGNTPVNDGQWHHIAAVYDGTDKIIYVDGVEDARVSNPHSGVGIGKNVTRYGFIGDGSEATSFNASRNNKYFKGTIKDMRFWDTDKNGTEIQSDLCSAPIGNETDLLAWWNMDSGKGSSTLIDLTGNGHNGTLYNFDLANCWGDSKYYDPGMLSVTKTTDEHDNVVKEYKDKLGNVVLKRVYLTASDILDTYYIYDDFNNLRVVLPPEAVRNFDTQYNTNPQKFLDNWAFLYKYDARQRMTHKKVPGADWVYMVYDERDRLILTQDGNQRDGTYQGTGTDWMFTKYDTLNRPIITGIYAHSMEYEQEEMQSYVNDHFDLTNTYFTEQHGNSVHGYTNHAFPTDQSKCEYLTVTYYDDYDFLTDQPAEWGEEYEEDYGGILDVVLNPVRGQVTGSKTRILGTNNWTKSVSYYDRKYRVIKTAVSNLLDGVDLTFNKYDFVGNVLESNTIHNNGSNTIETDVDYSYDHANRLIQVSQQVNSESNMIEWTDLVGVVLDENDLVKTGSDGYGNGGAATKNVIPEYEDGWIEITIQDDARILFGLSEVNTDAHYNTIDYCIFTYMGNGWFTTYEDGSNKGITNTYGGVQIGDVLRVERINGTIYYKKNGQVLKVSATTSTSKLIGDVALYYTGDKITSTRMSHGNKVLLVENDYNELGELVDKQLHSTDNGASFMQSVDYRYNIRGWLKSINNSALANNGTTNDDDDDFFGMELGYNTDIGTGAQEMYNGNISSIKWSNFGAVDGIGERAYNYGYDKINRLLSANHMVKTGAWMGAGNSLKVDSIHYDYNGNIKSLNRRDLLGGNMDLLTYNYGSGISQSNKLLSVTDAGNDNKGFKDGNTDGEDYFYDANGNMHVDKNKGIQSIRYNHLNLPDSVGMDEGKYILYTYDAAGVKLRQTVYDSTYIKQTDYIGGFIYEDTVLQLIQHAEGRIVPEYTSTGDLDRFIYEYHLKDHLGNVRLTFTSEPGEDTYTATLENATQQQEQADFHPSYDNITRSNAGIYDHTDNGSSTYSLMIDGQPGRIIGLAKSMQVLPGDTVNMQVFGKYLAATSTDNNITAGIAAAITGAFGLTASATGELLNAYNSLNGLFGTGPLIGAGDWEDDNAPKAYLNYILFDRNFVAYKYLYQGKELQQETEIYDFHARGYDPVLGRTWQPDPMGEMFYDHSPYSWVKNNPLLRIDPTGMTDYTLNKETGEISEVTYDNEEEQAANDAAETDRIVKTKKDGTIKRNRKGVVKSTSVRDIEKGILADGQNFKTETNIIEVGGEGQPSEQGVEAFALKLSGYVGVEIGGAYFSSEGSEGTSHITFGTYGNNSHTRNVGGHGHALGLRQGLNLTGFFHTHPGNGHDISNSDRLVPSDTDLDSRDRALQHNPSLQFFLITAPVNYGDPYPKKIPYRTGYSRRLR